MHFCLNDSDNSSPSKSAAAKSETSRVVDSSTFSSELSSFSAFSPVAFFTVLAADFSPLFYLLFI
jgi:hypothetical protein